MPKVHHVKSARKPQPEYGIEAGDEYWWAKFRVGMSSVKKCWKRPPKASELTMSPFLSELYAIEEDIEDLAADENLVESLDDIKTRIEELRDQCQEGLDNLPDHLQDSSPTGELLQERIDAMEGWHSEFDGLEAPDIEHIRAEAKEDKEDPDDAEGEAWEQFLEEIQGISHGL